ncbi:adenylate/guanylate cyclase domain-containing protein [Sorangium atrum]|uniref:Adenylate/guanylate cyclase domain-containing protein n=1 Tax=Sorangium atrum TaxID=2995308 RepID=A0ABT5CB77_9BACT|nr:adenylate/guanylate cyclase domain-containing protein [Sorangium aterium]MDC0683039.1 adenylate/guanylate cyclase domain-containing protein [Sorangium aterium]
MRAFSLKTKAIALFTAIALVPVAVAVTLLTDVNQRAVRTSEESLQASILSEVASASIQLVRDVESDAVAAAAIFGHAASGAIRDEDAVASVRALVATRALVDAVRLEVPDAGISTLIRKASSRADVPAAPAALRRLADERGVGFGVIGPARGLLVARVRPAGDAGAGAAPGAGAGAAAPPPPGGPAGYVIAEVALDMLGRDLEVIAGRRFGGRAVRLLIAGHNRQVIAAFGVPGVAPGSDASSLPIWRNLPPGAGLNDRITVLAPHDEGGRQMIGAIETVPDLGWAVAIWRPEPEAFAALDEMRRRGLAVAAGALVLALALALVTARHVTRPILHLVAQARLIGARRWREIALGEALRGRRDEIGELTTSLGRMAQDLEQGEADIAREAKLRGDLGRFMDRAVVDAIVRGEHPLALGGKRAAVSVLFADVVGFTPLAESRDAERMVALLNELFSMLTEIVFRHGGTVDKFIGDCVMAVWGAPIAQEDHARRALAAAEDMMRFLETANEEWRERYDVEVRLGVGVNSGEAIVGNIGSDKRMEYTVIGDVVNVASRLEAIAAPNQVLVSAATRDLAGDAFPLRALGERNLTGRKTTTAVYALDPD